MTLVVDDLTNINGNEMTLDRNANFCRPCCLQEPSLSYLLLFVGACESRNVLDNTIRVKLSNCLFVLMVISFRTKRTLNLWWTQVRRGVPGSSPRVYADEGHRGTPAEAVPINS